MTVFIFSFYKEISRSFQLHHENISFVQINPCLQREDGVSVKLCIEILISDI